MPNASNINLGIVRKGDKTTPCPKCGKLGTIANGEGKALYGGLPAAVDRCEVLCGCPPGSNKVIAPAGQWLGRGPSPEQQAWVKRDAEIAAAAFWAAQEAVEQAKRSVPVFAKSGKRGAGNTEAGTNEEPHINFGRVGYYLPAPIDTTPPEPVQHAQAAKRKPSKAGKNSDDTLPWYKRIFGTKSDAPAQAGMPLAAPVATGAGAELAAAGWQGLRYAGGGFMTAGRWLVRTSPTGAAVIGMLPGTLNEGEPDMLAGSQLSALAGKSAPTRIRFQWVNDNYGRLKPVAYHTGADCGLDQVRVRSMERNRFTGNYEFWADGADKPTIVWTPDEVEFKAPANTGNRDEPYLPSTITVLPLPSAGEAGSTSTSLPIPDEKSFDDYILVNLPHGMPPIYIYLSNPHKYHSPPQTTPPLPAFPDAKRAPRKTAIQGGGGLRARWKDSNGKIYEWDSQHGTVEVYDKTGRKHLGEFDSVTGEQTKPADPTRRVEK